MSLKMYYNIASMGGGGQIGLKVPYFDQFCSITLTATLTAASLGDIFLESLMDMLTSLQVYENLLFRCGISQPYHFVNKMA